MCGRPVSSATDTYSVTTSLTLVCLNHSIARPGHLQCHGKTCRVTVDYAALQHAYDLLSPLTESLTGPPSSLRATHSISARGVDCALLEPAFGPSPPL